MKPLTLDIAGLNGFRARQTVDFGRLLDHGIFGIFGPTGSGKSSVLDAMTLALYGRVKRAANGKSGVINLQEKTCTVSLTFEMDADGVRRRYTVERSLGRASGSGDGVVTRRARLIEHDGEEARVVGEKQGDIDRRIVELLGIEYDEFLRAVVLPQGSFAEFLGLTPAERSRALQRLFGLSELGQRLAVRLRRVADDVKGNRQEIEGRLAELRSFDDDALAVARDRAERAAGEESDARIALDAAEQAYNTAAALHAACTEYAALLEAGAERNALEQERNQLRDRLERAERAATVAAPLQLLRDAAARVGASRTEYGAAVERRLAAEEALARVRDVAARARERHAASHASLGAEAAELDAVATGRDRLASTVARRDERRRELEATAHELARREEELQRSKDEEAQLNSDVAENEARIAGLVVSRELLDELGRQRTAAQHLRTLEQNLAETRQLADQQSTLLSQSTRELELSRTEHQRCEAELVVAASERLLAHQAVESREERRAVLLSRWQNLKETLAAAERDEAECLRMEEACRGNRAAVDMHQAEWTSVSMSFSTTGDRVMELEETRRAAFEELQNGYRRLAVATLAPHLHDGQPCPLCGSIEHPGAVGSDAHDEDELARLKSEHERADREYQAVLKQKENVAVRMQEVRTKLDGAVDALARDERAWKIADRRLRESLVAVGEERELASVADLRRYVEEIEQEGKEVREELRTLAARLEEIDARVRELTAAATTHDKRCATIEGELAQRQREHAATGERITELAGNVDRARSALHALSGGRELDEIEADLERLLDADRTVEHLRRAVSEQRSRLGTIRADRDVVATAVHELTRRRDVQQAGLASLEAEIAAEEAELDRRYVATTVEAERHHGPRELARQRRERAEALERARADAESQLQEAQEAEKVAAATVSERWDRQCADERDRDRRERELSAALATAGFASPAEADDARLERDEIAEARSRVGTIGEQLVAAARRLQELEQVIDGRTISPSELAAAVAARESARTAADTAIGETAAARAGLAQATARNAEYHRVVDADVGFAARARTIDQLGRYLQGDAFINYLADEKLADVCVRASRLLQDLTSGRFALVSRPSVGFVITDFANGAERSPASLSGGETFLVSLALALALSDTIQLGRSPLEFFFLDEGFGTLDEDLLETVVGALERLRSQHRTIGLITHVAMLRERIPRRLVISPPTATAGSVIAYEVG